MAVDVRNALDLDSFLLNSGQESTHITTENKDQAEHEKLRESLKQELDKFSEGCK